MPFFQLDPQYRRQVFSDTTFQLDEGEVYTLHALQKNFTSKASGLLLRQETFHKQSFSDDRVYVNFYNYSAEGFYQAPESQKIAPAVVVEGLFQLCIRDTMGIYLSLYRGQAHQDGDYANSIVLTNDSIASPAFDKTYLTTLRHDSFSGSVMPYVSFPLWMGDETDHIYTDLWERFYFLAPGLDIHHHAYSEYGLSDGSNEYTGGLITKTQGNFAVINSLLQGQRIFVSNDYSDRRYHAGAGIYNLVINTHSGVDNHRSFATVNSIEVINGQVYLTTIQRRYAPPIYQ